MLDRIRAALPALPPAEQRVAKLVLADPRAFASLPVRTGDRFFNGNLVSALTNDGGTVLFYTLAQSYFP